MSNDKPVLTRQGVRDLNHLKGTSPGRRIETPDTIREKQSLCPHPIAAKTVQYLSYGRVETCNRCGKDWTELDGDYDV